MMCQRGITTIHPRQQFCEDLMQFLQAWKTQNEVILLAGDFNEAIGTNVSGMTKLCADLGLVDLMQSHHDGIDTTPTYVRGNTRIDYVLATPPM
jgi:endonuclease/exonuclease/phosphatase family metal-dependent hydrolase